MSKDNGVLSKLMNSPSVKNIGLKQEAVTNILKAYNDIAIESLLENGYIELGNGMIIEVVQLVDRVHVLRGTPYKSTRKFKLKLTLEDRFYKKIEEYYDRLKEEIL